MCKLASTVYLAAVLTCGVAVGEELRPIEGKSISLGDVSGVAYYTVEKDGFAVVAIVASGEIATPVRFKIGLSGRIGEQWTEGTAC
jgi:hypothetical protein